MNDDPIVLTLSDDEIEIQFSDNWRLGRQYNYLAPLFASWVRLGNSTVRVRL
jgi:hypothetical protein